MKGIKIVLKFVVSVVVLATFASAAVAAEKETTGKYIDDSVITAKVKADLVRDPITKAREINVSTEKGVVQLSGFVDTQSAKDRAEEIANGVEGVKDVINNIEVKGKT